jgi:hypothetical protein
MLAERLSLLLTAYVDGEVTPRQRRAVERLLEQSAEARALLQQLQEDANTLRGLPRRKLEADFSGRVLRTISERRLLHSRRAARLERPAFPGWVGLAAAASVLFVVAIGSYLYFETARKELDLASNGQVAPSSPEKQPRAEPEVPIAKNSGETAKSDVTPEGQSDPSATVVKDDGKSSVKPAVPENKEPKSASNSDDPLAATPNPNIDGLKTVRRSTPLPLVLRDLEREDQKKRLTEKLRQENAFRLELPCRDVAKALERLQIAFKAQGVQLVIDGDVVGRMKGRPVKGELALYTEGLNTNQLAKVLERLSRDDKQATKRRDGQFETVVVLSMTTEDQKGLAASLGVDSLQPAQAKPANSSGPGASNKAPDRLALVVWWNNRSKAVVSKEVRQFLDSRKERVPGAVPVLVVLTGM